MKRPWPSMLRTVAGDHHRFEQTYFSHYAGVYFTGDGARRDGDGYYWIQGRVDDVINVSGHRMGTAEIESALVGHHLCCEAAVVPIEHPIKGQGIYACERRGEGAGLAALLQRHWEQHEPPWGSSMPCSSFAQRSPPIGLNLASAPAACTNLPPSARPDPPTPLMNPITSRDADEGV